MEFPPVVVSPLVMEVASTVAFSTGRLKVAVSVPMVEALAIAKQISVHSFIPAFHHLCTVANK